MQIGNNNFDEIVKDMLCYDIKTTLGFKNVWKNKANIYNIFKNDGTQTRLNIIANTNTSTTTTTTYHIASCACQVQHAKQLQLLRLVQYRSTMATHYFAIDVPLLTRYIQPHPPEHARIRPQPQIQALH